MSFRKFLEKQFIDIIQWNEPADGVLSFRYPITDMEIQSGAQLTVRESQMAALVNEGRIADVYGPGLHTLTTRNMPLLTDLMNWDKDFQSPFKSEVYFFSTRLQIDQRWGTSTPITIREKEFGAARLRAYGIYSYRIADPRAFFTNVSGTRELYVAEDLEGQLRETIVSQIPGVIAPSGLAFLDMAANQSALADKVSAQMKPVFAALGLSLNTFAIENLSLADELQKVLDQRIGMGMAGDLGRYTQFEVAQSLQTAAGNPGEGASTGVELGAGVAMAQTLLNTMRMPGTVPPAATSMPAASVPAARLCSQCSKSIPAAAKFCPECGKAQS